MRKRTIPAKSIERSTIILSEDEGNREPLAGMNKSRNEQLKIQAMSAVNYKLVIIQKVLESWHDILQNPPPLEDLKWSDYVRVTELSAKHSGMLDDQSKPLTINNTIIDIRATDEKQLAEELARLKREREQPAPIVVPSAEEQQGQAI